jgi:hypothetical protein
MGVASRCGTVPERGRGRRPPKNKLAAEVDVDADGFGIGDRFPPNAVQNVSGCRACRLSDYKPAISPGNELEYRHQETCIA